MYVMYGAIKIYVQSYVNRHWTYIIHINNNNLGRKMSLYGNLSFSSDFIDYEVLTTSPVAQ